MKKTNPTEDIIDVSSVQKRATLENDYVRESVDLNALFGRVSAQIAEMYSVIKGVLVIRQQSTGRLAAISTWEHGHVRDGLTITLPAESSLFEEVIAGEEVYIEELEGSFSGNFFERKLLTAGMDGSIILKPLYVSNRPVGLVGYCSLETDTFSKISTQSFNEIVEVLSPHLDRKQSES